MAKLKDKVQNTLDEGRILVLGTQVLIGNNFRTTLQPGFDKLSHTAQWLKGGSLLILVVALGLLITPAAYHRIVRGGEDHPDVVNFTARMLEVALMLVAVGLGIEFFVAVEKTISFAVGIAAAVAVTSIALFFWYGLEFIKRGKRATEIQKEKQMAKESGEDKEGGQIADKIKQVLTETRVALPGAQALLGFLFATTLVEGFEKLPASSKYVHLACLALIALSTILLIAPAAYHRIVEEGEETENFHRVASKFLLCALVPMALGVSGAFFIVARKIAESTIVAVVSSAVLLLFFYGLWFGYMLYRRRVKV